MFGGGLYVAIGVAAVIAAVYFYCTVRYMRTYSDSEVPTVQLAVGPE
tara:strand:+ start:1405 stop:1545 length:141 start_codon:yes stop_codon:yes gene_type:complete